MIYQITSRPKPCSREAQCLSEAGFRRTMAWLVSQLQGAHKAAFQTSIQSICIPWSA